MEKEEAKFVNNTPTDAHLSSTPKTQNMIKQKSHSPELTSRPLVTRASQENDVAKIQKILESTKEKLDSLAESYKQVKEFPSPTPKNTIFAENFHYAKNIVHHSFYHYDIFRILSGGLVRIQPLQG